jgi:transcription elongation factor GreA
MGIERKNRTKINLMTQSTRESLLHEVRVARSNTKQSLLDIGEAAGKESDWHDNAAFDYANMKYDVDSLYLKGIEAKLRDVEIIKPSEKIDLVNIGNSVVIKLEGNDDQEIVTVLGPADSGRHEGWISFESPIGSILIGKKKGETSSFTIGSQERKVKIIDILPGDF